MRSDDEMSPDGKLLDAKCDYEALAGSSLPNPQGERLGKIWLIDGFGDQDTRCPGQEHGLDPFLLWSFVKPDRYDFNIGDNQPQYNFHWLESLPKKYVGLYVIPKAGDSRSQGDEETEGFSTCRKSPLCESTYILFLLRRLANSTLQ